ncbi:MAG: DUF1343 domain-containing protein [Bacteroidota bacterium]
MKVGAQLLDDYLPRLAGKRIGLTVNHSSLITNVHLLDTLQELGVKISAVFTPEHGFSGTASDGMTIEYDSDSSSFNLVSLYGKSKKPTSAQLSAIDIMVFDIQDVGTRFFTYLSTMHYVMEACAENDVPLIVLDRPNPNGSYVDGPVLDTATRSFVGMHPIPVVHGMTLGELALMINGERWLKNEVRVDLQIVPVRNWSRDQPYSLLVKPSPNLPDDLSIALYPSLCLFEGTIMSVGRGTKYAFQQIGHPDFPDSSHSFTPRSIEGASYPPFQDQICYGRSWIGSSKKYEFDLQPLIDAYQKMDTDNFFNDYFTKLAGTEKLRTQIEKGMSEAEIRSHWQADLSSFLQRREQYLLYN